MNRLSLILPVFLLATAPTLGQNSGGNWFTNPTPLSQSPGLAKAGHFFKRLGQGSSRVFGSGMRTLGNALQGPTYPTGYAPPPPTGYQYSAYQPAAPAPMQMHPIGTAPAAQVIPMRLGDVATPNVFGGYNITHSNGQMMTTTMPNVFGGQNITTPNGGMVTTMPNVFGGQNIYGNGGMTTTMPNVFGGQNVYGPHGGFETTMPNVFGGQNAYGSNGGFQMTTPNVFGGFNSF